ncbi:hypothetical protein [Helicobacter macacae]|uniref:hypothetical protein n=1 Tax=Helicobacter macacae TaxID=398626 RepID=UPI0011DDA766|nr:hypothetical protein [Helicobacter macacae]
MPMKFSTHPLAPSAREGESAELPQAVERESKESPSPQPRDLGWGLYESNLLSLCDSREISRVNWGGGG